MANIDLNNFKVVKFGDADIERNYINDILHALASKASDLQTQIDNTSGGGGTGNAFSFLTAVIEGGLPQARQLVGSANINVQDGGPGTTLGLDLIDTAVTAGTYGDASNVPQITIDAKGRVTNAVDIPFSGGGVTDIIAGDSIDVDATNPAQPIVSVKTGMFVDATDATATGAWFTSNIITDSPTGLINVYNPTGIAAASAVFTNVTSGNATLGGITASTEGRILALINADTSTANLILTNRAVGGGDTNWFFIGTHSGSDSITLSAGTGLILMWHNNGTESGWYVVSRFGGSSGVAGVTDDGNPIVSVDNTDPANPVITLNPIAHGAFVANNTGSTNPPTAITGTQATALLDVFTTSLKGLVPPAGLFVTPSDHFLDATGNFSVPGGGTAPGKVVSVNSGTGINVNNTDPVNPIINLANTAVTPGAYGDATHVMSGTVDAQGRFTAASNVAITFPSSQAPIQIKDEGTNQGTAGAATTWNFIGSGVTASVAGSTATINVPAQSFITVFDPRTQFFDYSEMLSSSAVNSESWTTGFGNTTVLASTVGVRGSWRTSLASGLGGFAGGQNYVLGGGNAVRNYFRFRVGALSTSASRYAIDVGWRDNITGAANDGLYIEYSDNVNSGAFTLKSAVATVITIANGSTALVANTWYDCYIDVNTGGTQATLVVNGNVEASLTVSLSSTVTRKAVLLSGTTGVGHTLDVDYMHIIGDR